MNRNRSAPFVVACVFVIGLAILLAWPIHAQRTASNPLGAQLNVQDAGTCSTTNSFAWQTLPTNAGTTSLNLSGTFTATVTVRESNNGGGTWSTAATLTTTGTTTYATNGFTDFCADVTAFTSGTVQVSIATGLQQVIPGSSALAGTNGQILYNNNGVFGAAPWTVSGNNINTPSGTAAFVLASNNLNINDSSGSADFGITGSTGAITIARTGSPNPVSISGVWTSSSSVRFKFADQGSCTMAAGTCSAQTLGSTYTAAPIGFVTWTGAGTCTGLMKWASTTTTATPSSSAGTDTCVVNWIAFGN